MQRCYRHDWVPRIRLCFPSPLFWSHVFPFPAREQGESQTRFLAYSSGAALPQLGNPDCWSQVLRLPLQSTGTSENRPRKTDVPRLEKGKREQGAKGCWWAFPAISQLRHLLRVARLTPLALHLWIPFWYGGSKYLFLWSWGVRACPNIRACPILFCYCPGWRRRKPLGERRACFLPSLQLPDRGPVPLLRVGCVHVLLGPWHYFNLQHNRPLVVYQESCVSLQPQVLWT